VARKSRPATIIGVGSFAEAMVALPDRVLAAAMHDEAKGTEQLRELLSRIDLGEVAGLNLAEVETLRRVRAGLPAKRKRGQHKSDTRLRQKGKTLFKCLWLRALRDLVKQNEGEQRYKKECRARGETYVLNARTAEYARKNLRRNAKQCEILFDGKLPSVEAIENLLRLPLD
jgi:hypothetical protein